MKPIDADASAIAMCGLYCGACKRYRKDKCPGCAGNDKASWCKIRGCCLERGIRSCADCDEFADVRDCKLFDNFLARVFSLIFNSNRAACIDVIRETGYEAFAEKMAAEGRQSLPR